MVSKGAQLGPVEIFDPMGEPLRFSQNFARNPSGFDRHPSDKKGKIGLKKPRQPLKIWGPKRAPNTANTWKS